MKTICAGWRMRSRRRCAPARWASRPRGPRTMSPPTAPGGQPHRRLAGDRPLGRAMAAVRYRHLPDWPRISGGEPQRVFSTGCAASRSERPARQFGVLATRQGSIPTRGLPDPLSGRGRAAGGRVFGQATTRRSIVLSLKSYLPFDTLQGWQTLRKLPFEEQKRHLADPELRRSLIAEEARMKPRDSTSGRRRGDDGPAQAGVRQSLPDALGRAGTRPVADLARQSRQAPGRGDHRPVPRKRQPGINAAACGRSSQPCAGHSEASADTGDILRFRRPCVPGDGLGSCRPTC